MEERYRGVHTRRALHRRRMPRRARVALVMVALAGAVGAGAAEAGVLRMAAPAPVTAPAGFSAPTGPVVNEPVAEALYDADGYRRALEDQIGNDLSDTGFAEIEEVAEQVCGWDREEFAGWVAVNTDDGTLADVHLDVEYRCPQRETEIAEALRVIAEARRSCTMPKTDDPEIREMIAGKPAQAALTCVFLTKPITTG
ncbi:hypothetical protein [Actinoplanes xinjiangensis]|jgi:hypothetical protein|uniref:Uncharacterized protein n=1 Tax=Actinoplanes xinjiangensis TaxID=512350 RepID=A0A316G0X7_9ACTN|nr:hypothetical protein [Actinoplanes xinjiangensis]PWK48007.1 hypothetical protein BC793_10634 [Actinoplanes xinjiangensis]